MLDTLFDLMMLDSPTRTVATIWVPITVLAVLVHRFGPKRQKKKSTGIAAAEERSVALGANVLNFVVKTGITPNQITVCGLVLVVLNCLAYLWTWRGVEEGMPKLLDLFEEMNIQATYFTTGQTAETHPDAVTALVEQGHELACHGYSHNSFALMSREKANEEITTTNSILRQFAPVTSFRAPYLSFQEEFVPLLIEDGITVDSSRAAYKSKQPLWRGANAPYRQMPSVTSSVLRLPNLIRNPWFRCLKSPVTLFVHPWEFVDLRDTKLRLDCRFKTGDVALACLRSAILDFKQRDFRFRCVRDFQG